MKTAILKLRNKETGEIAEVPAIKGTEGKSAYQSALDGGYTGTEEEFNKQLALDFSYNNLKDKPFEKENIYEYDVTDLITTKDWVTVSVTSGADNPIKAEDLIYLEIIVYPSNYAPYSYKYRYKDGKFNCGHFGVVEYKVFNRAQDGRPWDAEAVKQLNFTNSNFQEYIDEGYSFSVSLVQYRVTKTLDILYISNDTWNQVQSMIDTSITNYDNDVMAIIGEEE